MPADTFELLERGGVLILLVISVIVFGLLRPDTFLTSANWQGMLVIQSVLGVLAIALLPPLICGRFDVSIGSNAAACSIAVAAAMSTHHWALFPAIVLGVVIGTAIGTLNGALVAYLGVNSIIGTLGVATVLGGLITAYTKGIPISSGLSPKLADLANRDLLGVPWLFVITVLIAVVMWFILTQTPFGRILAAVGSNIAAAQLTGLRVKWVVLLSFALGGFIAGLTGVLLVAQQGNASPALGGFTLLVPALAAAFLGATTWRPGQFNVPGTMLGLILLGTVVSGLTLIGVEPWVNDVFNGAVVVVAVAVSAQFRRTRTGRLEVGE
jgi:ribose transport system permease protein